MRKYRSATTIHGRNIAGARALWRATGMTEGDVGKPIIAVVNSFTQFVPGHVHLKDMGQLSAREIEAAEIDILGRGRVLDVSEADLAARCEQMNAKGKRGWTPAEERERKVSYSLRAYTSLATRVDNGAVRDISKLGG